MNQLLFPDIRVRGGHEAPAEIRSQLDRRLGNELDEQQLAQVQLLATEVVSNSVRHGGVGADGWVRTAIAIEGDTVRVEIHDSSEEGRPEPRTPDYNGDGGGFGLLLLDRIASAWGVRRDGGLCVWFELGASA